MKLRSNRVLKRGKPYSKSGKSSDKPNSGEKGAIEAEIGEYVDNADENLELGVKDVVNMGSEVLDPVKDLVVSCPKEEIEEESVGHVQVEEGNKSMSMNSSETGLGSKEETKSQHLGSENGSEHVDSETLADDITVVNSDNNKETLAAVFDDSSILTDENSQKRKGRRGRKKKIVGNLRKKESNQEKAYVNGGGGGGCKRGRKRKNVEGSECNGDGRVKKEKIEDAAVHVGGRVLRSRSLTLTTVSGGLESVDGGLKLKKKVERRGRPRKSAITDENPRPKKKLKRRGRPRKVKSETMSLQEIPPGPTKSRGRPRKKDTIFKKHKHRGRPTKMEAKTLATRMIRMRNVKLVAIKGNNVEKIPKIQKLQKEEKNEKNAGEYGEKLKLKQLLRDKLVDILLKSGWKIERRPRQDRVYKDAVYIEPSGRSHWSITRAYAKLKKKIEDGDADNNEISAFIPIPEEEMSILFRHIDKELGYKKKKNRIGKNVKKKPVNKSSNIITKSGKPSLLARGSEKGSKKDNDGSLVNTGKRNLLMWMIDSGVILPDWKVQYGKTRRQKRLFEGVITSDGICCSCCNEVMGLSEFVGHAGGQISQSFDNLYLESGTCFRKCLMDSWKKEEESNGIGFNVVDVKGDDPNDDTCNICGDGGDLICCDGCPSTFHQSCLGIQNCPSGDWNCIYCSCKFCGVISVTAPQVEDAHHAITSEMLSCCLCEEKFHQLCSQEVEALNIDSKKLPFCGRKCQEIYERLQTYLGVKLELGDGFSWTLLQRCDVDQDLTVDETQLKVEHNSKLAVAFSVMDECFVPIIDQRSGTNIIHNVVYNCGSNFRRLNYAGFLTAILEKDDELITAASIRIHGYQLAEMPFIGTRHMYRRQGMCGRLLSAIESTLSCIGVEDLIIPAIPELLQTWTQVFGFMPLEELKKQEMKCMSMVVFPRIDMLNKRLLHNHTASGDKVVECTVKPNDESAPQLETESSNAIDYKDTPGVGKDVIDYERMEKATVLVDNCSCPEPNENKNNNSQFETTSSGAVSDTGVGKDVIDHEQTEETTVLMDDGCKCPNEDAASVAKDAIGYERAEEPNDKSVAKNETSSSNATAESLCDLNIPVKNVETQVPCDTDVQTSDDSAPGVKVNPCPLTSKLVLKNTFDLNLDPSTAVETGMHHIISDDSLPNETQVCLKSIEISESRSRVDHGAGGQTLSKPCDSQPLGLR